MQKRFIIPDTLCNLQCLFKSSSAFVVTSQEVGCALLAQEEASRQESSGHLGSVLNFGGVLSVLKTIPDLQSLAFLSL